MEDRQLAGKDVFLSVGGTANADQERFVSALEERLRAEGLVPNTDGRNKFSSDAPLKTVERLMDTAVGVRVEQAVRLHQVRDRGAVGGDQRGRVQNAADHRGAFQKPLFRPALRLLPV